MASASPVAVDECAVCFELMKEPRVLKCGHAFCLKCLQEIEYNREVTCPVCRAKTVIKKGFSVKMLPKHIPKKETKEKKIELLEVFEVDTQVVSLAIDEAIQVIYVGRNDREKPIEMFSYDGSSLGFVVGKIKFGAPRLSIDARRGLLLAVRMNTILTFDRDGTHLGIIECPEFQHLDDITYDVRQDKYIVVDKKVRCIMFVDPDTYTVTRNIPAEEKDELLFDNNNVCVASDKSGKTSLFATTDSRSSVVRLYDGDGLHVKGYKNEGSGYGQFFGPRGVAFNSDGQAIVSDCVNSRLVYMSPDAARDHQQWSVLMDTTQHKLHHPRAIDITGDGIIAVVFWSQLEGPFKIGVFSISGYLIDRNISHSP